MSQSDGLNMRKNDAIIDKIDAFRELVMNSDDISAGIVLNVLPCSMVHIPRVKEWL
jgi:hypothetical protein